MADARWAGCLLVLPRAIVESRIPLDVPIGPPARKRFIILLWFQVLFWQNSWMTMALFVSFRPMRCRAFWRVVCYSTKVLQSGTTCQKRSKIITEGSLRCYAHTISIRQRNILSNGLEVHLNFPRLWKFPGCSTHWNTERWFSQPPFSKATIYMSLQLLYSMSFCSQVCEACSWDGIFSTGTELPRVQSTAEPHEAPCRFQHLICLRENLENNLVKPFPGQFACKIFNEQLQSNHLRKLFDWQGWKVLDKMIAKIANDTLQLQGKRRFGERPPKHGRAGCRGRRL